MPITEWEFLRATFVVVGLDIVPRTDQLFAFRDLVGTEISRTDLSVMQGVTEEGAGVSQSVSIPRDRISIESDNQLSFLRMDYPREGGVERLGEVAASVLSIANLGDAPIQMGYVAEFRYDQDEQNTAAGYLGDRLFGSTKVAVGESWTMFSGWGRMSFTDHENVWQIVVEPRFQDHETSKVFLSMNLHRPPTLDRTKEAIIQYLRSVAAEGQDFATKLDQGAQ